jgi:hypothetical protein
MKSNTGSSIFVFGTSAVTKNPYSSSNVITVVKSRRMSMHERGKKYIQNYGWKILENRALQRSR